jgi:hypothetical protein
MSNKKIQVDIEMVRAYAQSGLGTGSIAKMVGVSRQVVRRVFKECDIVRNATKDSAQSKISNYWSKINKSTTTGCWLWQGSVDRKGYGRIHMFGKRYFTHRLSYILTKGEIPEGLFVCHKCDTPNCCNPNHLFLGTPCDNVYDAILKNRMPTAKLNPDKVRNIRKLISEGVPRNEIANLYNIRSATVGKIVRGIKWRSVQ